MKNFNCTYREGSSFIYSLSSLTRLVCYILLLSASLSSSTPLTFLISIAAILVLALTQKLPLREMLSAVIGMKYFFIFIFILNAFLSDVGEAPFFRWHFISLSAESITTGLTIILHVILAVMITGMYTMTSTPLEITEGMRILFQPLSVFRIPVDECARIISLSLQLIPILIEETNMIIKAQCARGAALESHRLRDKAKDILPLVIPVFTAAFRRSDELATAMEARGYNGEKGRTREIRIRLRVADAASMLTCALLLTLIIIIRRFV